MIDILDFGADPTGVADAVPAFLAAINAFGGPGDSRAGIVIIPPGTYRFAATLRIKKCVEIRGLATGASKVLIKPDPGITPFYFERYNTPSGTPDSAAADNATLANMYIRNAAHKVGVFLNAHCYSVGDRLKVGPGPGQGAVTLSTEIPYPHYECTHQGISATTGAGPQSFGTDKILHYKNRVASFVIGAYVYGATSGASGIVCTDDGISILRLTSVAGTFVNNEDLTNGAATTHAQADGTQAAATDDEANGTARFRYIGPGSAIRIRANGVLLDNVTIDNMSGCGVYVTGGDIEEAMAFANANGWLFRNLRITNCDGHGAFLRGSDTNGGTWIGGVCAGNGGPASDEDFSGPGFNICEASFLGNTYVGVLAYTVGGQGNIYSRAIGGGTTFVGCYQEGSGGGHNICLNSFVCVGGSLSASDFRGSSAPTWQDSPAVAIGPNPGRGLAQTVRGHDAPAWRAHVFIPEGVQRANGGNIYRCIAAGVTASSGGPTGTGSSITDGSATWAFIHAASPHGDGIVQLGSVDPSYPTALYFQPPDEVVTGFGTYYRWGTFENATGVQAFMYGVSGAGGESGVGVAHAGRDTILTEQPRHVPAGRAILPDLHFEGGCKVQYSTSAADPISGNWYPGDEVRYKGAALVAGGKRGRVCVTAGTQGTYSGSLTATASGTTAVVLSAPMTGFADQQDFKVGDVLTINSVTARITAVASDRQTLTMSQAITTGTSLAITFSNATFKEYGAVDA